MNVRRLIADASKSKRLLKRSAAGTLMLAMLVLVLGTHFSGAQHQVYAEDSPAPVNLALNKQASASNTYTLSNLDPKTYDAAKAVDGLPDTRWATTNEPASYYLEVDFGTPTTFNQVIMKQPSQFSRILHYEIEYEADGGWSTAYQGSNVAGAAGAIKSSTFQTVTSSKMRLSISSFTGGPTISELEVYDLPPLAAPVLEEASTAGEGQVKVSWSAVPGAAGYRLQYGSVQSGNRHIVELGNVTSYLVRELPEDEHSFTVFAYDRTGISSASNELRAQTIGTDQLAAHLVNLPSFDQSSGIVYDAGKLTSIDTGDWISFKDISLAGMTDLALTASVLNQDARVELYVDSTIEPDGSISGGTLIGVFSGMTRDDAAQAVERVQSLTYTSSGLHTIYLRFSSATGRAASSLMELEQLQLMRGTNANADLRSLEVSKGKLEPAFDKSITNYTLTLYDDVDSVEVTAQVMDTGYASLQVNGEAHTDDTSITYEPDGITLVTFTVTAENGHSKVYTLTIVERLISDRYYVSPEGSDAIGEGEGTAKKPWKSMAYACTQVPEGRGATIHLAPGPYMETAACSLPANTSLKGAGKNKTILYSALYHDMQGSGWNYDEHSFLIQARNTSHITISDLSLVGKMDNGRKAHAGLFIHEADNVLVHHIDVREFELTGIWAANISSSHFYESTFYNTGYANQAGSSGAIKLGDIFDSSFHDLVIKDTLGADGIDTMRYGWTDNPYRQFPGQDYYVDIVRTEFYNLDIDVRQNGSWGAGQPGIAIELWSADVHEVDIHHNRFSDNLSLAATNKDGQTKTARVHHNEFIADPVSPAAYTYAIEASLDYIEVDHNYFKNGYYPIADFSGHIRKGLNIHHNVFDQLEGLDVIHINGGLKDAVFHNNIVTLNANLRPADIGKFPFARLIGGMTEDFRVTNNLFIDPVMTRYNDFEFFNLNPNSKNVMASLGPHVVVDQNLFFNWKPYGTNALTADPKLSLKSFKLQGNSPALAMGFEPIAIKEFGLSDK